ncbi:MAG: dynamin family protein [Thermoanaerobaculia bacterium]
MIIEKQPPQQTSWQPEMAFDALKEHRARLVKLTDKIASLYQRLDLASRGPSLAQLRSRLENDRFKIMVLGEFKRGKSTFVNALLGEDLLPAKVIPCTAVISEVRWGSQKRAVLHFRHPLPPKLPAKLPANVAAHLRQAGNAPAPSLEIPIERLRDYIEIPPSEKDEPEKSQAKLVAETPYERVEIWWPLELCRNGVEIIDSPGLNEDEARARITANYLQQVDAVLFTMLAMPFGATTEFQFIDKQLFGAGYEHIFYIINCWDTVANRQRDEVRQHILDKLTSRTRFEENGVFFVSALSALEGRLDGDPRRVESSGIVPLEKALTRFLTEERGRVKLLQPARELSGYLREIESQVIPAQRQMLENSLAELLKKFERVKPQLDEAERKKLQILQDLDNKRARLNVDMEADARKLLHRLFQEIPGWVDEMETEHKIKVFTTKPRGQVTELSEEIVEKVRARLQEEIQQWSGQTLQPRLAAWLKQVEADLGQKSQGFYAQLEEIQGELYQIEVPKADDLDQTSEGKRLLAAGIGFLLNPINGVQATTVGFKGLIASVSAQIAAGVTLLLLGASNPVTIIGMLLTALLMGKWTANRFERELRKKLGQILKEELGKTVDKAAEEIAGKVDSQVRGLMTKTENALTADLAGVREQVEAVLRDKRAGEARVQERQRLVAAIAAEAAEADEALRQTILLVAGV